MKFFLSLYWLRLKAALRSHRMLTALLFLLLTGTFALLLPGEAPASLSVGVLPQGKIAGEALEILLENGDYSVVAYDDLEHLKADVLSGKLHCGYTIFDEWNQENPVIVYDTDASYLRPLLDQLVLSAYFEAKLPRMTQEYLDNHGFDGSQATALWEKQRREAKTMSIELRTVGRSQPLPSGNAQNLQPLLYAVLVSLFMAVTVLEALLVSRRHIRARRQLQFLSGHPLASAAAPVLAEVTLHLLLLLAADGLVAVIFPSLYFPLAARLTMFPLLALATAVPALGAGFLHRHCTAVAALLPPWLLASVFFSGALMNPSLFPMGLGALRFVSPAWYALRWMALF